jgi:phage gpG-like protein
MINVTVKAKGEQLVIKSVGELPNKILLAASIGMQRGLLFAVGVAQREFMSGPRPERLAAVSGRLRASLGAETKLSGNSVIGRAGATVPYAAYHEFGFRGSMQVRAHTRVRRAFDPETGETVEVRRAIIHREQGFLGWRESKGRAIQRLQAKGVSVGAQTVQVRAHSRRVNYAGRPYLRPALEQTMPQIVEEINQEIATVAP